LATEEAIGVALGTTKVLLEAVGVVFIMLGAAEELMATVGTAFRFAEELVPFASPEELAATVGVAIVTLGVTEVLVEALVEEFDSL